MHFFTSITSLFEYTAVRHKKSDFRAKSPRLSGGRKRGVRCTLFLAVCLSALLLTACGTSGGNSMAADAGASGTQTAGENQSGDTHEADSAQNHSASGGQKHINAAFFWISANLDPAADYNGWVTSRLGIGETLVRLNDALKLEPCLADTWENTDETTWQFHIRDNVTFSNGNPVTAESVKAALERAVSKNDRAAEYLKIASMEADGQTLTIRTAEPNASLLSSLSEPVFDIIDLSAGEDNAGTNPVGTGPYKLASFLPERRAELLKNEYYWNGEPGLDSITVSQIADSDARVMALQSGETDLTNTIDHTSLTLFEGNPDYSVSTIVSPRVNVAYMNNAESSPLHAKVLRQAVSWAVNRDAYAGLIGGSAAHGLYSDAAPFGNEKLQSYGYDPEKANALLDEAGYIDRDGDGLREQPDGSKLSLRYLQAADHGSADSGILAAAVQSDLKAVGVETQILAVENLSEYQSSGNFDFYTANDNASPTGDPQLWLQTMYTGLGASGKKNLTSFHDDKIDAIGARMNQTFDMQARYTLAQEASQVLLDDAASLFLTNASLSMVSASRVKNAVQLPADYYFITKDITVE